MATTDFSRSGDQVSVSVGGTPVQAYDKTGSDYGFIAPITVSSSLQVLFRNTQGYQVSYVVSRADLYVGGVSQSGASNAEVLAAMAIVWASSAALLTLAQVLANGNDANALKITNLGTPTVASDAVRKDYVDALVLGLLDLRAAYDASGNTFPTTGGSGTAEAILKGDFFPISVGGTLGGVIVTAGDAIYALVDTPGQTSGNWGKIEQAFAPTTPTLQQVTHQGASTTNELTVQGARLGAGASVQSTFFGNGASDGDTGEAVTAFGSSAAGSNSGVEVTAIGNSAASSNSGNSVTAVGQNAAVSNSTNNVVAVGSSAGGNNSGDNLTAIGYQAANNNTFDNVNAVGKSATATADNQTVFGNTTNPIIINHAGISVSSAGTLNLAYGGDYVATGTTATYTLPAIDAAIKGRWMSIKIKNRQSGVLTVNANGGSNTVFSTSAVNTLTLAVGEAVELLPDGTFLNLV